MNNKKEKRISFKNVNELNRSRESIWLCRKKKDMQIIRRLQIYQKCKLKFYSNTLGKIIINPKQSIDITKGLK